jgi:hypothetical protein
MGRRLTEGGIGLSDDMPPDASASGPCRPTVPSTLRRIEFLHDLNRFNVLATRAKAELVVVASRELVSHISGDLKVIRSSEMLKDFVDTFCGHSDTATLGGKDGGIRQVDVELRTHRP